MRSFLISFAAVIALTVSANAVFEKVNTYSNEFVDVADTAWYAENVKIAYELGFMNGKSDGKFDPNGNVTVVEGLTMASRLHAIYRGQEVAPVEKNVKEHRFDFDDPSILVDLSKRNSRNINGINLNRAKGYIENGVFVVQPDGVNSNNSYDPQIKFEGLSLLARDYNRVSIRMKRDELPNPNLNAPRQERIEFFFETNIDHGINGEKLVYINLPNDRELSEWFEVEADLGGHEKWTDLITGIRLDPTNNNGIYYIDSIVFSKSESIKNENWYDLYVDYAIQNGIIEKDKFSSLDYKRNISRAEICDMFASAIPEEYFTPVNNVKGIPDVLRDEKNSDIYLMLYRAGILLGADKDGNFRPDADIKRAEIAAIINRVALPENRVRGTVACDWEEQGSAFDIEFENEAELSNLKIEAETKKIENGALVLKALERPNGTPRFDPKIGVNDINLNASDYRKLRIRMKADFLGTIENPQCDFYFKTAEDAAFSTAKSLHLDFSKESYVDPAGWYVFDLDLSTKTEWNGVISNFRFDPANTDGIYTVDYIRLIKTNPLYNASHEELLSLGYTATGLFKDVGFEKGFYVSHFEQKNVDLEERKWQDYASANEEPIWSIGPWWCGYDLWENRDTNTDKYTLTDTKGINTVKYNPEEKSLSLRVNATKIYNGEPHIIEEYKWWPHLYIDQSYKKVPFDKVKNSAAADRMFVEFDVKLSDFKDTINTEGTNSCQFVIYFALLSDKDPSSHIAFGVAPLNGTSANPSVMPNWAPESAAQQFMYNLRQAEIFGGMENSFNPEKGVMAISDEWKHVRVDITEHIERCAEWASRDRAFGTDVTKEDLYFGGCDFGFEIHGNYDCTVEIKNLDMIAYNKH